MKRKEKERKKPNTCEECGAALVKTPDGTQCCSECGVVVGDGYSWFGSEPSGKDQWNGVIDNNERLLEERVSRFGWG